MIARALGKSVAVINRMTPAEYAGWEQHFVRYPPVETILALLWLTVSRAVGNDKASAADVGYWLESPEQRAEREEREARTKRATQVRRTAEAYRRGAQA